MTKIVHFLWGVGLLVLLTAWVSGNAPFMWIGFGVAGAATLMSILGTADPMTSPDDAQKTHQRQAATVDALHDEIKRQQDEHLLHLKLERRQLEEKSQILELEADNAKRMAAVIASYEHLAARLEAALPKTPPSSQT